MTTEQEIKELKSKLEQTISAARAAEEKGNSALAESLNRQADHLAAEIESLLEYVE